MNSISKEILENYQVRKTNKQKLRFIDFIKKNFPQMKVETGGIPKCRNLVLGDPDNAEVIFSAHYDTCAVLPFPNLIFPRNFLFSVLYSLLICIPFFVIMILCREFLLIGFESFWIRYWGSLFIFLALFLFVFVFGIPNKHTANDNTSGVISILEIYSKLSDKEREKCAFVLFDHEETGLFGSSYFKKCHKKTAKNTLLINLDCVGDGDNLMFVIPKTAKEYKELIKESFDLLNDNKLNLKLFSSSTTLYPSDQAHFRKGIGVATLHRKKFWGYYLGRIHTSKDTVCNDKNIKFITDGFTRFINIFINKKS